MQLARSLVFNASIYVMMLVYAIVFFIPALLSRDWAHKACDAWCAYVIWAARWMVGLRAEVRGLIAKGVSMLQAESVVSRAAREDWALFDEYHLRNVVTAYKELEWE